MADSEKYFKLFLAEFEKRLKEHPKHADAYEATAEHFNKLVGNKFYSSYESFQTAKSKFMKKTSAKPLDG